MIKSIGPNRVQLIENNTFYILYCLCSNVYLKFNPKKSDTIPK